MHHLVILYDSITNSVFESQVLKPLKKIDPTHHIVIISFEYPWHHYQHALTTIPQEYTVHILHKMPLLGSRSLWYAQRQLRSILALYSTYSLLARGQIAGYLCIKNKPLAPLTIQIRGLLAQEYNFVHQNAHALSQRWHHYKQRCYQYIEDYCIKHASQNVAFEFVSQALQEYYHHYYSSYPISTTLAQQDIPKAVDQSLKDTWRKEIRTALSIAPDARVYCYNGSAKPWQCADEAITYFKQQPKEHCYLLILTPDIQLFEEKLKKHNLSSHNYRLLHVAHEMIYQYLASADYGLIFRKPHPINWTSRPTKVLEYQAVGLPIIHNNTISMLCS